MYCFSWIILFSSVPILFQFKEELPASISFLENCLHVLETDNGSAIMPTVEFFGMPEEECEAQLLWSNTLAVPAQEITCQVMAAVLNVINSTSLFIACLK